MKTPFRYVKENARRIIYENAFSKLMTTRGEKVYRKGGVCFDCQRKCERKIVSDMVS